PTNNGYKSSVLGRLDEMVALRNKIILVELNFENSINKNDEIISERFKRIKRYKIRCNKRTVVHEIKSLLNIKTRHEQLFSDKNIRNRIEDILEIEKPSIIVVESLWALHALPRDVKGEVRCVIHDVAIDFFREMFKSQRGMLRRLCYLNDYIKLQFTEVNILNRVKVDEFVFLTEEDKEWYQDKYNIKQLCSLASNHLYVEKIERKINHKTPFLLIPGSIEFAQNYHGLNWFVKNIYPNLNKKIKVIVTGKASQEKIKMLKVRGEIYFSGELDVIKFNELCSACLGVIAPITTGTGIKIKILEAVQKGIPVVTTKFASKGIDSLLCFYGDDNKDSTFIRE
ncbi:glycosyltransferase, partial [Salmonella enterica subsp. enterica]|nr:glycosyltransferase [Salmonella enterica subsp. enterica]